MPPAFALSQDQTLRFIASSGFLRLSHELDPTLLIPFGQPSCPDGNRTCFNAYLGGYARHARTSWSVARPTRRATQRPRLSARARHLSMPWAPPTYPFHSILCSSQRTVPTQRCFRPVGDGPGSRPTTWGCQRLETPGSKKPVDREFSSSVLGFFGGHGASQQDGRGEFDAACSHAHDAWIGMRSAHASLLSRAARRRRAGARRAGGVDRTTQAAGRETPCATRYGGSAAAIIPPPARPAGRAGGAAHGPPIARSASPRPRSAAAALRGPGNPPSPAPGPG